MMQMSPFDARKMFEMFEFHKSASFKLRKMFEMTRNQSNAAMSPFDARRGGASPFSRGVDVQGSNKLVMLRLTKDKDGDGTEKPESCGQSDMELMKERFAKLLLGEDMSGRGKKGVPSALPLSNAITNLGAYVVGEQRKLEAMKAERKQRWRKEVDWLLSVTDHIVQLVPSQQQRPDGTFMEVMASRQRKDLLDDIPALRKLDAMLMDCLDSFSGQNEFRYVNPNELDEPEKNSSRTDWWIPEVKVPEDGLSERTRKLLQHQKECVNQVLEAAVAINAEILSAMEIPESYIDTLPKNGKESLGDLIYKSITDESFDPEQFLGSMDLSSEEKVVDLKNRIEASTVIWKRKMVQKDGKASWSSLVSLEKRELFEERSETILLILKHYFPGIPQSSLDVAKIEHNKDVGHAVLEGYSRVLESLASAVMCRIDQVLHADSLAPNSPTESNKTVSLPPGSVTLLDFMGWKVDQGDDLKKLSLADFDGDNDKLMSKLPLPEIKRISYLERLENWGGVRSPTARH